METKINAYKALLAVVTEGLGEKKPEAIALLQEIAVACALLSKILQGNSGLTSETLFSALKEERARISPYPPPPPAKPFAPTTIQSSEVVFSDDVQKD